MKTNIENYEIGDLEETVEPSMGGEMPLFSVLYRGIYAIYSPY